MDNCVLIWFDTSQFLPIFSGLLIGTWVMHKACPWRHQHTDITLIFTQTHQHHFFLQGRTILSLLSIPNKLIGLFTPLNGDQYIGIHCMHCQVSRNATCMHFYDSYSMSSIFPNSPPLVGQQEFRSLILPLWILMILQKYMIDFWNHVAILYVSPVKYNHDVLCVTNALIILKNWNGDWTENVVILRKFSSRAVPDVVFWQRPAQPVMKS